MTRDSLDMASHQVAFRRRTMASSEMKEFLSTTGRPGVNDFGMNNAVPDCPAPVLATSTRRMSLRESVDGKIHDWEEERLDIEGFVVDYFIYRINQERGLNDFEISNLPGLPCGVQPEHEMMRDLGIIFEKKHSEQFKVFAEQLLAVPKITFNLYKDVVQTVGLSANNNCPMSYGRLIGLISFSGMLATMMMESPEVRGEVPTLFRYTSLFIKTILRQCWKEHNRSWAQFMELGKTMKEKYDREVAEKEHQTGRRKQNKRWSMITAGMTASAIGIVGVVICGRMIFNCK